MQRNARGASIVTCALLAFFTLALAFALRPMRASELPRDAGALVILDRGGAPLGTVLGRDDRHTFAVPLARMGRWFPRALIAAEDGRFAMHGALDPLATVRALADGLRHGRLPAGASTIDMQLARTLRPMPPGWRGQIAETLLARRLDDGLSKDEILAAYANRAPMGANVYGVEAAARTYFGVSAADLDLAQSATLAALPNGPTNLDPYAHSARLRARTRYVLARMRALGTIDPQREAAAANESLNLRPRANALAAAQFCFFQAARTPPDRDRVRTTIDAPLQRFVEEQMRAVVRELAPSGVRQAAAIVVENSTAAVRAYAGSVAYDDIALGRNDGVQALRQPGSALKPFLYELAFERRAVRPYDILADVPTAYAIPGARLYAPLDYSTRFLGPVRPRIALADSLNVPAVRVLERTGVAPFLDRLRALGFAHLTRDAGYYGLGLTLGGGEVSLWELARAYLTLARGGQPTDLMTVEDDVGDRTAMAATAAATATTTTTATAATTTTHAAEWAEVTDILADPHARAASFGVNSILALPYAAAVKTGTSSDFRDTWTVGYTRDYTVAVWVGNFDGTPMRHISGVTGAAPIWSRIMRHLHATSEPPDFAPPAGWRRTAICTTQARRWTRACARADEWLDRRDVAALEALDARDPHPRLGAEFDGWLAAQPVQRRDREGARIFFPRAGDTFVADAQGRATIDLTIGTADRTHAALSVDGRTLRRSGDAYVVRLTRGSHDVRLRARDGDASARVYVVAGRSSARAGFELTRR